MRRFAFGVLILAMPISGLQAQTMPLPQFLTKATALKKKGPLALFSGDLKLLQNEIKGSAGQLRAERLAAVKAGRKPGYCPPEKGSQLGAEEVLSHFQSIPAAQRQRMQVKDGMRSLMAKKFPCPA